MRKLLLAIMGAVIALTFSMCSYGTEEIPFQSYWKVNKMVYNNQEIALPEGQTSEMFFMNNMDISGLCGCNTFFASFWANAEKGTINIEPKMRSRKMCPDMNYEEKFIENLTFAKKYSLSEGKMLIKDKDGNTLFELQKTQINKEQF